MTTHFPPPTTPPLPHVQTPPADPSLGRSAKSVDADPSEAVRSRRSHRFALQRQAARLLTKQRVCHCRWSVSDNSIGASIHRRESRARFAGLQTCGSVWHCPVCSHIISERRRVELNEALSQARSLELIPVLITLTFSHKLGEPLPDLLKAMKNAKKHFHMSRTYRNFKPRIAGTITATEITKGENGWHPHFHILMFLRGDLYAAMSDNFTEALAQQWRSSLEKFGRFGNHRSFDFQMGDAAGQYVAKWGVGEELTLGEKKSGKGLHPFQLLEASKHDKSATAAFMEYALAFKGSRQLLWSPGLKDLLSVDVLDDDTISEQMPDNQDEWLMTIRRDDWNEQRHRGRSKILDAAEAGHEHLTNLLQTPFVDLEV